MKSMNSTTNYFEVNIDQKVNIGQKVNTGEKVNIGQISKIVSFHLIDLKFEEDSWGKCQGHRKGPFIWYEPCGKLQKGRALQSL